MMIYRGRNAGEYVLERSSALRLLAFVAAGGMASAAQAEGTAAGTKIENVATATYGDPGSETTVTSNKVSLTVDELLDVSVAAADPGDVSTAPGATGKVLSFTLTNAGNGSEAFRLTAEEALGGDDFDPSVAGIALDANGNGAYDPGVDTAYVAGINDPVLAPDASLSVFVISKIPASGTDGHRGRIDLKAVAKTGSGAPGTTFANAGQGGGNAVAGASGAEAEDDGYYRIAAASMSFVKSAAVADPFGGTTPVPGAIITFTLTASVSGSGTLTNVKAADPIPAGTTYSAGSITLDGAAISDAEDSDSGFFTGSGISAGLGNIAAGSTRTITFKVKID